MTDLNIPATSENERPFYRPLPPNRPATKEEIARFTSLVLAGHLNVVGQFTFASSPQVIKDPRVSPWSCILLSPMASGSIPPYVSIYGQEEFTVEWGGGLTGECRYTVLG